MPNHFSNEVDGQLKFYQDYLPLVDKTLKQMIFQRIIQMVL